LARLPVVFLIMGAGIMASSARSIQTYFGWTWLGVLVVVEGLMFATTNFVRCTMEGLSISISDKAIERRSDGRTELTPFEQIRKVSVTYDSAMKVTCIQVDRKRSLGWALTGYENMDGLAVALEKELGAERVHRRNQSFDQDNPGCFVVMIVFGAALGLVLVGLGREIFQIFYILFFGCYGLYGLIYRPYTRSLSPRFAWFEILGGVVLVAITIWLGLKII
jgi:hypothetical protein